MEIAEEHDVVVGIAYDLYVAVVPRKEAQHIAAINKALYASKTMGALREAWEKIEPGFFESYVDESELDPDDEVSDSILDPDTWPPPVLGWTYDVVPEDLAARFGEVDHGNPSGRWLQMDEEHLDDLVRELVQRGWRVERDDDLIVRCTPD